MVNTKNKRKKHKFEDKVLHGLIVDKPHVTLIIARKGSGKSSLLLDLLLNPRGYCYKYDRIIFISPTFEAQYRNKGLWSALNPKGIRVVTLLNDEILQEIISEQEALVEENVLVIFDDNSEKLRHLDPDLVGTFISNSRHLRISAVFLLQKLTQCPTVVRASTDVFISFSACSEVELSSLFREVSVFEKKQFLKLFREITKTPFAFLTISVIGGKITFYDKFDKQIGME